MMSEWEVGVKKKGLGNITYYIFHFLILTSKLFLLLSKSLAIGNNSKI